MSNLNHNSCESHPNEDSTLPTWLTTPDSTVYRSGVPLFVDFETTTHKKGLAIYRENSTLMAAWRLGWDSTTKTKWGSEYEMQELLYDIGQADFIVAYNAKFDLQWLARCGVELHEVLVYDPLLAEYVIGGNRWQTRQLGLDTVAKRRGLGGKESLVSALIKGGIDTRDIPDEWLERYCVKDVDLMIDVMRDQLKELSPALMKVVYARCLLTTALADIETEGLKLDEPAVLSELDNLEAQHSGAERELNLVTGGINLNSRQQLAKFLYETLGFGEVMEQRRGKWVPRRTDGDEPKTDADTLDRLKPDTEEQRDFLEKFARTRELHNRLSKYMRKFADCCREVGGVMYGRFNQTQTQTHRLSSTGLDYTTQYQNLPREYKGLFKAKREGWLMAEADGAQLEFRVAGHLCKDEQALRDAATAFDVHRYTASVLHNKAEKDVTKDERNGAKANTFKPLYGGSSGTKAEQAYYAAFKAKYPGVARTQQAWIDQVLNTKRLVTEWGLVYYWPDTTMDRSGYVRNTTAICNYPVQAFATAEMIPMAVVYLWHRLKRIPNAPAVLVNTIHDSIIAEVHPEWAEEFRALSMQALTSDMRAGIKALYGIDLLCQLGCGTVIGPKWGDGEEIKYEEVL